MLLLITRLALISLVQAHGFMFWPKPRLVPGDAVNGFSIARSASFDACHGLSAGPVLTPQMTGGAASIDYAVTAYHMGGCTVYLDRGNGWEHHIGKIEVNIPSGDYKAVIRWHYETANCSGEQFNTCSDITVSSSGTNSHTADTIGFTSCEPSKDSGFQQCAAVNKQGVGIWFQKSCPVGVGCIQTVVSDPSRGVLGKILCGGEAVQNPTSALVLPATTSAPPVVPSASSSAGVAAEPRTEKLSSILTASNPTSTFSASASATGQVPIPTTNSQSSKNQIAAETQAEQETSSESKSGQTVAIVVGVVSLVSIMLGIVVSMYYRRKAAAERVCRTISKEDDTTNRRRSRVFPV
ncbi:hypothetical protein BDR26DRAFT_870975 [Obelidium mucronatum]|nr:hypothetical protein BDR26DRAFT_870975 [Obelidium mucronatum]